MNTLPRLRTRFSRYALVGAGLCAVALWGCDDEATPAAERANFGADNSAAWKPNQHRFVPRRPATKGVLGQGPPQDFSSDSATHSLDPDLMGDTLVKNGDAMMKTRDEPHLMDESNTLEKGIPTPIPKSAVPTLGETLATNLKSTLQPTPMPTPAFRQMGTPTYSRTTFGTPAQRRAAERQRLESAASLPPPTVAVPTTPSLSPVVPTAAAVPPATTVPPAPTAPSTPSGNPTP